MMTAFERVPVSDVLDSVSGVPYALLGVGPQVNLSPRFDWHAEKRDGRLVTFHGEGLPLKTWLNLKTNRLVTRALIDPASFDRLPGHRTGGGVPAGAGAGGVGGHLPRLRGRGLGTARPGVPVHGRPDRAAGPGGLS